MSSSPHFVNTTTNGTHSNTKNTRPKKGGKYQQKWGDREVNSSQHKNSAPTVQRTDVTKEQAPTQRPKRRTKGYRPYNRDNYATQQQVVQPVAQKPVNTIQNNVDQAQQNRLTMQKNRQAEIDSVKPKETSVIREALDKNWNEFFLAHKKLQETLFQYEKDLKARLQQEQEQLENEKKQFEKEKADFYKLRGTQTQSQANHLPTSPQNNPNAQRVQQSANMTQPNVQSQQNKPQQPAPQQNGNAQKVAQTQQVSNVEILPRRTPDFLQNLSPSSTDFALSEPDVFHVNGKALRVHYTRDHAKIGALIKKDLIKPNTVISMAIAWNGYDDNEGKTALFTFSTSTDIYLFHVVDCIKKNMPLPAELVQLLVNDKIIKVGADILNDVDKIYLDWNELYVSGVLNINELVKNKTNKRITFAEMTKMVLGVEVEKILPPLINNDNWELQGLSGAQMLHEAKSAHIVYRVMVEKYHKYQQNVLKHNEQASSDSKHEVKDQYGWLTTKYKVMF
jgi:hypothetical protein